MDKYHYERQTEINYYSCGGENYNADFNDCFIAASFIKNYKLLKNSVMH